MNCPNVEGYDLYIYTNAIVLKTGGSKLRMEG